MPSPCTLEVARFCLSQPLHLALLNTNFWRRIHRRCASASDQCLLCLRRLQLLNTTVASLALAVNDVLSQTYRAVYGGEDGDELILTTAPLAATSEVQALYTGHLIDFETAMYAHDLPQHPLTIRA